MRHDIVVIGASAGGVELLLELAPALPPALRASVFVVVHTAPGFASTLPELLTSRGPLRASHPQHGEAIEPGRIYVAPPDAHLQVRPGAVEVVRGPKENGHRPAVDALFRSAARAYGPRVVAIVLTGHQDCGTAGALSVKARGGVVVVQDPATAPAPAMPSSVLSAVDVDHVAKPIELPGLIARLAEEPAHAAPAAEPPSPEIGLLEGDAPGPLSPVVCPACGGTLTEAVVDEFRRFRCHEGHAFSQESLRLQQEEEVERALWSAARALDESAALSDRLSVTGIPDLRGRFAERARTQREHAAAIRRLLTGSRAPVAAPEDPR